MARHQLTRVFDSQVAFEEGFKEVTRLPQDAGECAEEYCLPGAEGQLERGGGKEQGAHGNATAYPANAAFPGLTRTGSGR